jgi:hypothetical protein
MNNITVDGHIQQLVRPRRAADHPERRADLTRAIGDQVSVAPYDVRQGASSAPA